MEYRGWRSKVLDDSLERATALDREERLRRKTDWVPFDYRSERRRGGVGERLKPPVLKTGDPQGSGGSNPYPSALSSAPVDEAVRFDRAASPVGLDRPQRANTAAGSLWSAGGERPVEPTQGAAANDGAPRRHCAAARRVRDARPWK